MLGVHRGLSSLLSLEVGWGGGGWRGAGPDWTGPPTGPLMTGTITSTKGEPRGRPPGAQRWVQVWSWETFSAPSPTVLIFKVILAILGLSYFHVSFSGSLSFLQESCRDSDWDCRESVHPLGRRESVRPLGRTDILTVLGPLILCLGLNVTVSFNFSVW